MSYSSVILAETGLVAYYRLNEASGTTANDSKGTNNGTFVNSGHYTLGVTGLLVGDTDLAASFDGAASVGGTVRLPAFALGDGPFTFECWIKRSALSGTGKNPMIAAFDNGLEVGLNPSNSAHPETVFASKAGTGGFFTSTTAISDTTTAHHIVVTKNGATTHIYIDGVDQTNTSGTNLTLANGAFANAWLASDYNSTNPAYPGVIDEAAIYSVVLTSTQVSNHYAAGKGAQTLSPSGIASAEAFGSAVVLAPQTLLLTAIGSAEAFGSAAVTVAGGSSNVAAWARWDAAVAAGYEVQTGPIRGFALNVAQADGSVVRRPPEGRTYAWGSDVRAASGLIITGDGALIDHLRATGLFTEASPPSR